MGFGKDGKGIIIYENERAVLGGALNSGIASISIGDVVGLLTEDFRLLKVEGAIDIQGLAAGEMCVVGLADGQLTAAEIQECLAAFPVNPNDYPAIERSHRPVFLLGYAAGIKNDGHNLVEFEKTIRWTFSNPDGWMFFLFNPGANHAGALTYILLSKAYGVWVR